MPRSSEIKPSAYNTNTWDPTQWYFPTLNNVKYLSLIDANSGYHSLKLDERLSYLTIFACQFGRYTYKRLPFGAAPVGDMFQQKNRWNI